jgi:hypothetical protein
MSAVLLLIAQLYAVEKIARRSGLSGDELRLAREHGARPALDRLRAYLIEIQNQVLPKSEAGQAVAYTLKNWTALTRYCSDADLPNRTERSIRGIAVGRGNWTFFGSDRGGKTAAVLRSFISSCESRESRSVRLVPRRAQPHCRPPRHSIRRPSAPSLGRQPSLITRS